MPSALGRLAGAIDTFSEWTGRVLAWLTLLMVLVTFFIVVMRYAFNWGRIDIQESVIYMHSVVFLAGAAYTLKRDGHVRVDIFYREMGPRARAIVDLLGTLLLLAPTMILIIWVSLDYVGRSWSLMEASPETGGLPGVYLLKSLIIVAAVLVLLQGLSDLLRCLLVLGGHQPPPRQPDTHLATEEV